MQWLKTEAAEKRWQGYLRIMEGEEASRANGTNPPPEKESRKRHRTSAPSDDALLHDTVGAVCIDSSGQPQITVSRTSVWKLDIQENGLYFTSEKIYRSMVKAVLQAYQTAHLRCRQNRCGGVKRWHRRQDGRPRRRGRHFWLRVLGCSACCC